MDKHHSLYELNEHLRRVVALNFPGAVWVRAEVGQMNVSGGHIFLDLVQKADGRDDIIARSNAVIWRKQLSRIRSQPGMRLEQILQEGNELLLKAKLSSHERYGLQLTVEDIDADFTLGQLLQKRTATTQRLSQEGLLHRNRQIPLPLVIQRIAVISSPNAAGLQDYSAQMRQNPYGYAFLNQLFPANMQGDRAAAQMAQQLQSLAGSGFHIALIIRGGGARLDLSAFDEYQLGKAIAECPIPVLTGVGHDTDETVADMVAHTALKTPTAVAEFIIQHNAAFEGMMWQTTRELARQAQSLLQTQLGEWQLIRQKIAFQAQQNKRTHERLLTDMAQQLKWKVADVFHQKEKELQTFTQELLQHDWDTLLENGYALLSKDGRKLESVELLAPKDHLNVILRDGRILVEVKEVQKNKHGNNKP